MVEIQNSSALNTSNKTPSLTKFPSVTKVCQQARRNLRVFDQLKLDAFKIRKSTVKLNTIKEKKTQKYNFNFYKL